MPVWFTRLIACNLTFTLLDIAFPFFLSFPLTFVTTVLRSWVVTRTLSFFNSSSTRFCAFVEFTPKAPHTVHWWGERWFKMYVQFSKSVGLLKNHIDLYKTISDYIKPPTNSRILPVSMTQQAKIFHRVTTGLQVNLYHINATPMLWLYFPSYWYCNDLIVEK